MQLSQSLTYLRVKNTCCHCPVEAAATECFLTYLLRHPSCLTRTEACYLPYKLPKKQSTPMIWNCHLCYLISIDFLTFSDTSFNTNANPLLVNTIKSFPNLWWLYVYRTLEWVCTKKLYMPHPPQITDPRLPWCLYISEINSSYLDQFKLCCVRYLASKCWARGSDRTVTFSAL